jgi:hypothetical protein
MEQNTQDAPDHPHAHRGDDACAETTDPYRADGVPSSGQPPDGHDGACAQDHVTAG